MLGCKRRGGCRLDTLSTLLELVCPCTPLMLLCPVVKPAPDVAHLVGLQVSPAKLDGVVYAGRVFRLARRPLVNARRARRGLWRGPPVTSPGQSLTLTTISRFSMLIAPSGPVPLNRAILGG